MSAMEELCTIMGMAASFTDVDESEMWFRRDKGVELQQLVRNNGNSAFPDWDRYTPGYWLEEYESDGYVLVSQLGEEESVTVKRKDRTERRKKTKGAKKELTTEGASATSIATCSYSDSGAPPSPSRVSESDTEGSSAASSDVFTSSSGSEGEGEETSEVHPLHVPSGRRTNREKSLAKSRLSMEWRSCSELPVRMKNAQAVQLDGAEVYVGGGYTGDSKTDPIVYAYDLNFDLWTPLPPAPLKWFGMAVFQGKLVLVGGKSVASKEHTYSNKLAVWDPESRTWTHPLPPMPTTRISPAVFSHRNQLVVAGGRKGVLDYNVEILDGDTMEWTHASSLPLKCSSAVSLVKDGFWYLLKNNGIVFCTDLDTFIASAQEQKAVPTLSTSDRLWQKLYSWDAGFVATQITSIGDLLVVLSQGSPNSGSIAVHVFFPSSQRWCSIGKLPSLCAHATGVVTAKGELLLMGGDMGDFRYSNKVYRVCLQNTPGAKKKKRARVMLKV